MNFYLLLPLLLPFFTFFSLFTICPAPFVPSEHYPVHPSPSVRPYPQFKFLAFLLAFVHTALSPFKCFI